MQSPIFHIERNDTDTFTVLHQEVERKVLDEEVGVVAQRLTVEGMKDGVACSVGGGGTSVCLSTFTVFEGLTTKGSLVDLALSYGESVRYSSK
jgi:hypothetical protein